MIFPKTYKCLNINEFKEGEFRITPIRYEDRLDIMKWRNEQLYHLRQVKPLTEKDQENYFKKTISKIFNQDKPGQILFSYLKNNRCIGYGGLVHINWIDKNAELSFVLMTDISEVNFTNNWKTFLKLIEKVAFEELNLKKIYTYAFDLRPQIYPIFEDSDFVREAELKNHCYVNNEFKSVIIHSKYN